jgi:hypothetical protein
MSMNQKGLLLFIVCCVLSFLVTNPQTRNALLAFNGPGSRTVLATIDYHADNHHYKVVKLGMGTNVAIEIYKISQETGQQTMQSVFSIPYSRDTFFTSEDTLSNLFLSNLDDDADNEIIVPVLDENLVSHLTVIKYDKNSQSFSHHDYVAPN